MFDPKTKILVVDDMKTMRKIVIKICTELGFSDFTEAGDGAEAWEAMSKAAPGFGLVISDWNMPNTTGLDLLKRVRADSKVASTPFVLVTAEAEQKQVAEALGAGVDTYVVKPFNKETLQERLASVYKKYHK